ncbi:virulence-associated V antigen [Aeromonas hydrophila]|uniref:virulence-associated V antigen n=1 Tax=Aeromonas hydrophila TaxID=644 RepID=UPI003C6FCBE4
MSDLEKVELNQLQGGSSSALDELVKLIKDKKIVITAIHDPKIDSKYFDSQVVTDNEALFKKSTSLFFACRLEESGRTIRFADQIWI